MKDIEILECFSDDHKGDVILPHDAVRNLTQLSLQGLVEIRNKRIALTPKGQKFLNDSKYPDVSEFTTLHWIYFTLIVTHALFRISDSERSRFRIDGIFYDLSRLGLVSQEYNTRDQFSVYKPTPLGNSTYRNYLDRMKDQYSRNTGYFNA